MPHDLVVEENATYTIEENEKEIHNSAIIEENGYLDIDGNLELTGKEDLENLNPTEIDLPLSNPNIPMGIDISSINIEVTEINMPLEIKSLRMVSTGTSMFLALILGITAFATVALRNYFGMIFWGLSIIILVLSGIYGLGLGLFWGSIILTVVVIILGAAVRVST